MMASAAVPLNRFIGRDREIAALLELLPSTRLLTLTGAGGSGKTRLASEISARLGDSFAERVWLDLAPIQDATRILPHLALALGVADRADQSTLAGVANIIGSERMLVTFDNCEHLVDACAGVAEALLHSCPQLTIVATSREALGVPGEIAWLVPPMREDEAVQLFVERAQSVQPSFALTPQNSASVHEICQRLDGIPLAVELAAARVRVLGPSQIAARLSDAFKLLSGGSRTGLARHRTLRGAIDWSYALLTDREQLLLQRLTVFAGSFSIEAVEEICAGEPIESDELLDALSALVEKSLVVLDVSRNTARYRLLETVRQYGDELLRASGTIETVRARHAQFYLAFVESAEPRLFAGAADTELVAAVREESGNLRAAIAWTAADVARADMAMRFGYALHWYWFAQGQFDEGYRALIVALSSKTPVAPEVRGRALIALGHINLWQSRLDDVGPRMDAAYELLRGTTDRLSLAYALNGVGFARHLAGDSASARKFLDDAFAIVGEFPDHVLGAIIQYWRGLVLLDAQEFEQAGASFAFATALGRRINHKPAMGHPLLMSGRLALAQGAHVQAYTMFAEALSILFAVRDDWGTPQGLEGVASAIAGLGHSRDAARLLGAASAVRRRTGSPWLPAERALLDVVMESLRTALGDGFAGAWSEGEALTRDAALQLALGAMDAYQTPAVAPTTESRPPSNERQVATLGVTSSTVTPPAVTSPVVAAEAVPAPAASAESSSAPLVVRTMGGLSVTVDGERIDAAMWGSARSRELLVFLLCHPHGVTKEQVGAAFWPESSQAQVRNAFHVTLHRLRKALRHAEWIVVQQDRYMLDTGGAVDFDADRIERGMTAALRLVARKNPTAADALDDALTLATGEFMQGEAVGDWHIPWHDRMQRLQLDGLRALASLRVAEGRFADASNAARRILAVDPIDEDAWRTLMLAHARQGERTQALRLYQQLTDLLERELESEPDSATTRLYEKIQAGAAV